MYVAAQPLAIQYENLRVQNLDIVSLKIWMEDRKPFREGFYKYISYSVHNSALHPSERKSRIIIRIRMFVLPWMTLETIFRGDDDAYDDYGNS